MRPRSNTPQSVTQTRQHFQNVVLGLRDETPVFKEEYDVPPEQRVKRNEAGEILHGSPVRGSPRSAKGKEPSKPERRKLWHPNERERIEKLKRSIDPRFSPENASGDSE
jgi:hypothetical protein